MVFFFRVMSQREQNTKEKMRHGSATVSLVRHNIAQSNENKKYLRLTGMASKITYLESPPPPPWKMMEGLRAPKISFVD